MEVKLPSNRQQDKTRQMKGLKLQKKIKALR